MQGDFIWEYQVKEIKREESQKNKNYQLLSVSHYTHHMTGNQGPRGVKEPSHDVQAPL